MKFSSLVPSALCCVAAFGPLRMLSAQRPLNLDFERASVSYPDRPWGWTLGWSAFAAGPGARFVLDSVVRRGGRHGLRVEIPDSTPRSTPQELMLQLPAGFVRGKTVELRGWLRTSAAGAVGRLHLEAWGDRVVPAADTAVLRASGAWVAHRLRIAVPADSSIHSLVVMVSLQGSGSAWFDDLTMAVEGQAITSLPGMVEPPTAAELRALLPHAAPLRTTAAPNGSPDDRDLQAIDRIIAGARIVGLGESTHGTREFFQVKHRLIEYLVRVHGYRLFAIEANQVGVERINRYVQGGDGTAKSVARAMFAVWNTEEVEALIDWMRGFNAAHPTDPVRFAGYDMQDHQTPIDSLRSFLRLVEPALEPRVEALSREYRSQASYATFQVADSIRLRWAAQADTLWELVQEKRAGWRQGSTAVAHETVEWAVQAATLFRQAARFNVALSSPDRDSLMAVNVDWLLRTLAPQAKAIVWAHDVHVSHGGDPVRSFNAGAQMGAHLKRMYGDQYRSLSLLTYDGQYTATRSFNDHAMMAVEAFPAPAGSMEEALHRLPRPTGTAGWIVDLRTVRGAPELRWIEASRPIRHVGYAAYDYGFDMSAVLPLEFDGIVFVDRTTASRLLRREGQ